MTLIRRHKHKPDPHDPEKGNADAEQQEKKDPYAGKSEYEALLAFVQDESKKQEAVVDDDQEDEETKQGKRLWYAPWKHEVAEQTMKKVPPEWLKVDHQKGISASEAESRRKTYGYNELTSPRENQFIKFISYFRGPILYAMELAIILAAGLRDWIDFGVIIGILVMNAVVGWYQEKQAGDIVAQLKAGIALKSTVIRDGKEQELEARDLVPGDVIVLEEGSTIPADAMILGDYEDKDGSKSKGIMDAQDKKKAQKGNKKQAKDENNDDEEEEDDHEGPSICSVDQSAITGESLAVDKYISDVAYYTCGVKRGKCYAVVTCPARFSFVGKTAALVSGSNETGHFQIVLGNIGTTLLVLVLVFVFAVWIGGFFRSIEIATPHENSLLVYTLIFLIIGVPVGLPVVSTTCLAVGAAYLAKQKAIVQKLTAIESLAGVDILCSDKTGTLTANKLSLNRPFIIDGVKPEWFMAAAVLASSHKLSALDPIDRVIVIGLKDYPKSQEILKEGWTTKKFTPFDPVSKRITAEVTSRDGKNYTVCKGAPNAILKLASFDKTQVAEYRQKSKEFAQRGFRSLGVASKEGGKDWQLLGLICMFDPPRSDTAATVDEARGLGINVKMLTGDAVPIAIETAKQLKLGTNVYNSEALISGTMSGSDTRDFIEAADGFAEVFPEHKYQVVSMLQERGHLTAMTGDGVNDAPSLKKADCGIAVQGASDAARTAADVVFLDEGLSTIITSIKCARQIFHRLKAYIIYRIALCIHLEVFLLLQMLILNETIRVDLIVFLAIFADVATIAVAYDRAPYARQPTDWQLPKIWVMSTVMGLMLAAGTWIIRGSLFLKDGGLVENFGSVQEILFLEVALTESWVIFITRLAQEPGTPFVFPSWQLCAAVLGVDILASFFALFGWISGPAPHGGWTHIVDVIKVWLFSFGVVIVIACVYFLMNKISWLDNLGRITRSKKNEKLENFLTELQRLTIHHEADEAGGSYWRFAEGGSSTPKEREADKPGRGKPAKTNKEADDAKKHRWEEEKGDSAASEADSEATRAHREGSADEKASGSK